MVENTVLTDKKKDTTVPKTCAENETRIHKPEISLTAFLSNLQLLFLCNLHLFFLRNLHLFFLPKSCQIKFFHHKMV